MTCYVCRAGRAGADGVCTRPSCVATALRLTREEGMAAQRLWQKLADILHRTAAALHGGPKPDGFWSFHDLPELAGRLEAQRTLDGDGYLRVLSNVDLWLRIAGTASAEDLGRMLDGQLNISVIFEHEFERRFQAEHEKWMVAHE